MKRTCLICLMIAVVSCSQKETLQFDIGGDNSYLNAVPVAIDLANIKYKNFMLLEDGRPIPYQIDTVSQKLWFVHHPNRSSTYTVEGVENRGKEAVRLAVTKEDGNLRLSIEGEPVLQYRYQMHFPPLGVDSIFRKSGYIHPLLTPSGDTLTRINPPDHHHHYGIWGPWTHTQIDGKRVDFWNLGDGLGTVHFKKFGAMASGPVFADFDAAQEHLDFVTEKESQVALNENLKVTVWDLERSDRYMFDYNTTFNSPLEDGILFEEYRYGGGIGMRFTERWDKDNCSVITSEGKDRSTADGSNARWCLVSGTSADGKGSEGILFMSHPENREHPEPMRVWPLDANGGRGDMFFEFCPIRHKEWKIEPHRDYRLRYRMVVFDGELTPKEAEDYWQAFAQPPEAKIISN